MAPPVESLKDSATSALENDPLGLGVSRFRHAILSPEWENETLGSVVFEIGILLIFFTDLSLHGSDSRKASDQILGGRFDAIGSLLETVGQGEKASKIQNLKRVFSSPGPV